MKNAFEKITKKLNYYDIEYKVHTHEEIPTVEIAKQLVDFDINHCLKTIAFEYENKYLFVSILADKKIDYSKLCKELNISRSKLNRADSKDLINLFGFEDGGIGPFSISNEISVVIDKCLNGEDIVYCGSGVRNKTIELKYKDLISLDNTLNADVSK